MNFRKMEKRVRVKKSVVDKVIRRDRFKYKQTQNVEKSSGNCYQYECSRKNPRKVARGL